MRGITSAFQIDELHSQDSFPSIWKHFFYPLCRLLVEGMGGTCRLKSRYYYYYYYGDDFPSSIGSNGSLAISFERVRIPRARLMQIPIVRGSSSKRGYSENTK